MNENKKEENINNLRLGDKAPRFIANTTSGDIKLCDYFGKWLVLFSHPRKLYTCMHNRIHRIFKNVSRI